MRPRDTLPLQDLATRLDRVRAGEYVPKHDVFNAWYVQPLAEQAIYEAEIARVLNLSTAALRAEFTEWIRETEAIRAKHEGEPTPSNGRRRISPAQNETNADNNVPVLQIVNGNDLLAKEFKPIRWVAEGILPEGLGTLNGPPKFYKSGMALELSLAVVTGSPFMDSFPCERGRVLYLALEDNERRLNDRIKKLTAPFIEGTKTKQPDLSLLELSTEIPKSTAGGLELLGDWLTEHEDARLIVIDTLARFRSMPGRNSNAYLADSEFMAPLQRMALEHNCAVLMLHHTRKMGAADAFDTISGTQGLAGACDTLWLLRRESRAKAAAILSITGRDIESRDLALSLSERMHWHYEGAADELATTRERQQVLDLLREVTAAEPMRTSAIAKELGKSQQNISKQLRALINEGKIYSAGTGKYYGHF